MKDELILWDVIKDMLMRNTGSTTVLLEAITGCKLKVKVLKQNNFLSNGSLHWNGNTVCRESVLFTEEKEISHNIVYINWEELNNDVRKALKEGVEPIGKVIMHTDHRRELLYSGIITEEILKKECNINESCVGNNVLKKYAIWVGDVCLFIIYEIFYIENLKYCVYQRNIDVL
ncbi:MAG: chorismate pyruvate-lyase family protein [Acutalibacteraceae bacterium]|nr:chorismate pyruvate-lyase family protein [Acutalibacteraceae bacterium]